MKLYPTQKTENWNTTFKRWAMNIWPCIFCTGSRITFMSADSRELHVRLDLNLRTRNRVGTIFGGSIYSSVDPYFMLMFMEILGRDYVVWDKAASVKFIRPITGTVHCRFLISDELVEDVKHHIAMRGEYTYDLPLHYEDGKGKVYAAFSKTIYAASKQHYKQKLAARQSA